MSSEPIWTFKNGPKAHHCLSGEYPDLIYNVGGMTLLSIARACVHARPPTPEPPAGARIFLRVAPKKSSLRKSGGVSRGWGQA